MSSLAPGGATTKRSVHDGSALDVTLSTVTPGILVSSVGRTGRKAATRTRTSRRIRKNKAGLGRSSQRELSKLSHGAGAWRLTRSGLK